MIAHSNVLGVIPARGGSKGVSRKNVREVGGRPLIAWTIEAARGSRYLDRVILTSDDAEIITVAQANGCDVPFVRAAELADDCTPTIDVVLDALDRCPGYEWVVLLQPTSPLRSTADIDAAIILCLNSGAPACVSVCPVQESPYWMYTIGMGGVMSPLLAGVAGTRRQDLPPVYNLNGAVYVARSGWLRSHGSFIHPDTVAYEMPIERSLDIDTENDLHQLQTMLER